MFLLPCVKTEMKDLTYTVRVIVGCTDLKTYLEISLLVLRKVWKSKHLFPSIKIINPWDTSLMWSKMSLSHKCYINYLG